MKLQEVFLTAVIMLNSMTAIATSYYESDMFNEGEILIDSNYILVEIDTMEFEGWDMIYSMHSELDADIPPEILMGNIYRLAVSNSASIDILLSELGNSTGIIDQFYGLRTYDGVEFYYGNKFIVKFHEYVSTSDIVTFPHSLVQL
jgi:hypothetical protein